MDEMSVPKPSDSDFAIQNTYIIIYINVRIHRGLREMLDVIF